MTTTTDNSTLNWRCRATWRQTSINTGWCLLGCSIGDLGTILFFQLSGIPLPMLTIMALAMFNGLTTSVLLETYMLRRQGYAFVEGLQMAFRMSFASMLAMELAMNLTDFWLAGGVLVWWVIPIMLGAGFVVPLPYNYYRLKKYGKACH